MHPFLVAIKTSTTDCAQIFARLCTSERYWPQNLARLNYAIIKHNGRHGAALNVHCYDRAARRIDRRDFDGGLVGAGDAVERKKREKKKRLKVPRVKKKGPPSVKYCPENRTVFINPARKSVFMESLRKGLARCVCVWWLFGTLCVHRVSR